MDALVTFARDRIERGSKSFAAAARLLSPEVRDSVYLLYAWCRHCDDVVDGQELGHRIAGQINGHNGARHDAEPDLAAVQARVARLQELTRAACRGEADELPFQALARVVAAHDIPERHPLELIEGFWMDARGTHYASLDDTLVYCYHVAGVVGVMMAMVMGVRDEETLDRACDLGLAFQLTNIARDVIDDWHVGRIYLPADWLADAGIPADAIADPDRRDEVWRVTLRLLDEAEHYYDSAYHGLAALPGRSALAIAAARQVYREIGRLIRNRGAEAWGNRTVVSRRRKLARITQASLVAVNAKGLAPFSVTPPRATDLWLRPGR